MKRIGNLNLISNKKSQSILLEKKKKKKIKKFKIDISYCAYNNYINIVFSIKYPKVKFNHGRGLKNILLINKS